MPRLSKTGFRDLGEILKPPPKPGPVTDETWVPSLNPLQWDIFNSDAESILAWGEKGSGKSTVLVHKMVKHCYENENALAFILTPVKSMSEDGGAWHKLITDVLPKWSEGLGLAWKTGHDSQHNELVWIQNQHGSWSMVKGISAPHPDQLEDRFPGREPSFILADELTKCSSRQYYKSPKAQLGRRPDVTGIQQFCGACNPAAKSHWVYKLWFEEAYNEETDTWNPRFKDFYLPVSDNKENLQAGYAESLEDTYRHDPVEYARLVSGQWMDRQDGDTLFSDLYNVSIHVAPLDSDAQPDRRKWLMPDPGHAVILGIDPGSVYNSFVFEQWLPIKSKMKWLGFDEFVVTKKRIPYERLIPAVMRRQNWWNQRAGKQFDYIWISDSSAFNQYRAAQGSFDVLEIERIYEANREKFNLPPMKVRQAPKFNGSVVARVRLVQQLLAQDQILISSRCTWLHKMFLTLKGESPKAGEVQAQEKTMTPVRSDVLHVWDAFSYPIQAGAINPSILTPRSGGMSLLKPAA